MTTDAVVSAIKKHNHDAPIVYQPLTVAEDSGSNVASTNAIDLISELENEEGTAVAASVSSYATFDLIFRYTPANSTDAMPSLILDYGSEITANPEDDDTYTPKIECKASENLAKGSYGKTLSAGDVIKARARDAARVAFLFDNDGTINNKVWAPSEYYTISSAVTSDVIKGFYSGNLASAYKNEKSGKPEATVITAPFYESRVYAAPDPKLNPTNTTYSQIAAFPATGEKTYSELKVTVKVWLEGKDGDCLESVQNDKFAFLLKFRTGSPIVSGS